jgi:hypothetical protein
MRNTVCVSKVDSQGKKEEVPIQLVLVKKQKKGTSNDHNSQTKYKRRNRKWGEEKHTSPDQGGQF